MTVLERIDKRLELWPEYYRDKLNDHRGYSALELLNMFEYGGLLIIDRTVTLVGAFDEWLVIKGFKVLVNI